LWKAVEAIHIGELTWQPKIEVFRLMGPLGEKMLVFKYIFLKASSLSYRLICAFAPDL
jgi:hypothetical protein